MSGQLLKAKGHLIAAKGKILATKGDAITDFGKDVAVKALLSSHGSSSHGSGGSYVTAGVEHIPDAGKHQKIYFTLYSCSSTSVQMNIE